MPWKTTVGTLLISLIKLSLISGAQSWKTVHCPYEISINGRALKGDGSECFESISSSGVMAGVSAYDSDNQDVLQKVLVWDEDAPCGGDGRSYIHYSGSTSTFQGMTAGAGDVLHTYRAAVFADGIPVPAGTIGCYDFTSRDNAFVTPICLESWKVARVGSNCPDRTVFHPGIVAWAALLSTSLGLVAVTSFLCWQWRTKQFISKEYDSGEGAKKKVPGGEDKAEAASETASETASEAATEAATEITEVESEPDITVATTNAEIV